MTGVWWDSTPPPPLWQSWLAYIYWVLSKNSFLVPRIAVKWTCDQLDWFRSSSSSLTTSLSSLDYHSAFFLIGFLGCLGLFSNSLLIVLQVILKGNWRGHWNDLFSKSHLSIIRECNPPDHHKNHLNWVDWSRMVPWASSRLLVSDKQGPASPAWSSQEPSDLSGQYQDPPWLCATCPLSA
jgi:hypothetical protein